MWGEGVASWLYSKCKQEFLMDKMEDKKERVLSGFKAFDLSKTYDCSQLRWGRQRVEQPWVQFCSWIQFWHVKSEIPMNLWNIQVELLKKVVRYMSLELREIRRSRVWELLAYRCSGRPWGYLSIAREWSNQEKEEDQCKREEISKEVQEGRNYQGGQNLSCLCLFLDLEVPFVMIIMVFCSTSDLQK